MPEIGARAEHLERAVVAAPGYFERAAPEALAGVVSDPALAPGDAVGEYRVLREIGRGGMGVVYLAERPDVGLRAAVKVLTGPIGDAALDAEAALFYAERRHLAALAHPNVARLYDAGQTADGRPYFAMEHVDGETVTAYASRHGLGFADRVALFSQLCEAVRHVHGRGLVHGDVTPRNVLVADDDEGRPVVKLVDFGVAAQWRGAQAPLPGRPFTYAYTAPEIIVGGAPTPASDVFALGTILGELLAGVSGTPAALRAVVVQATRREINTRLPTVADLLADLRALSRHTPEPPSPWGAARASVLAASVLGGALAVAAATRWAGR